MAKGNFLKQNGGVPLDHPRRCQAHNRSKHFGREGQPCRRYAAKGSTVCTMHGGGAPQVKRKALLRQMIELDQKAQTEAAVNVLMPPELHPLVSGGGRGRRKAAPEPSEAHEPAPAPTLTGIANISRAEHLANQRRAIIDADPRRRVADPPREPPREPPGNRPSRPRDDRTPTAAPDDREPYSASRSEPPTAQPVHRLMTLEEAAEVPRPRAQRRVTRRYQ
jgi:hypothetical protein